MDSPSLETARQQSIISDISASVGGEGHLVRATEYLQEHNKCRPFVSDEFPRRSSKEPPDKQFGLASMEFASRHLDEDVVSKEMKAISPWPDPVKGPLTGSVREQRASEAVVRKIKGTSKEICLPFDKIGRAHV